MLSFLRLRVCSIVVLEYFYDFIASLNVINQFVETSLTEAICSFNLHLYYEVICYEKVNDSDQICLLNVHQMVDE